MVCYRCTKQRPSQPDADRSPVVTGVNFLLLYRWARVTSYIMHLAGVGCALCPYLLRSQDINMLSINNRREYVHMFSNNASSSKRDWCDTLIQWLIYITSRYNEEFISRQCPVLNYWESCIWTDHVESIEVDNSWYQVILLLLRFTFYPSLQFS